MLMILDVDSSTTRDETDRFGQNPIDLDNNTSRICGNLRALNGQ